MELRVRSGQVIGRPDIIARHVRRATQGRFFMLSKKLAAIAAVSLITASSAAVAQSAQPLSLNHSPAARASAVPRARTDLDRRGVGIYIVGAVVLGLIIWGIIELTKDDGSAQPVSSIFRPSQAPRVSGALFFCARLLHNYAFSCIDPT